MNLEEILRGGRILLLDGAMGTQLAAKGLDEGGLQNLEHPDAVREIHQEYRRSGARALIANTLTMNKLFLGTLGRENDLLSANRIGVELARSAAESLPVLGDISATGKLLAPLGDAGEAEFIECFAQQASILAKSGVDGFIVETMMDLREAVCALRACRQVASLPVFVTLAFATLKGGGKTMMGNSAEECAVTLEREKANAIGANCGNLNPFEIAEVIASMQRKTDLPLIAQPNAGNPRMEHGRTVFDLAPVDFARGLIECVRRGARIVGGCCGTGPEHIRAAADLIRESGDSGKDPAPRAQPPE